MKRAHGGSIVTDEEEQPGTRARISALIAGLHGVAVVVTGSQMNGCPHGTLRHI